MKTIVAIYSGDRVSDMALVGASTNPHLVQEVTQQLLREYAEPISDPVQRSIRNGHRRALQVLARQGL